MKRPNFNLTSRSYFVLLFIISAMVACTEKSGDTSIEAIKIDNVEILPKINCTSVEVPWLYLDGDALRKLSEGTYNNKPLYFSTTIKSCTMQAAGWFMKKKNKGSQDFDPGPQVRALPVGGGCGTMMQLPEGTFLSDFTMSKKQLKDIIAANSKWIILIPEPYEINNETFIKWKVVDTEDDPRQACQIAFQWPDKLKNGPSAQSPSHFAGNLSSPITPRNSFEYANPVPPYPAEIAF